MGIGDRFLGCDELREIIGNNGYHRQFRDIH